MNVLFLTGDHPRHRYYAQTLKSLGYLGGLVVETREMHIPDPPERILGTELESLYEKHFDRRSAAEEAFFGDPSLPDVPQIRVQKDKLNSKKMWNFVAEHNFDMAIAYGIHILSAESLRRLPDIIWNIHAGLVPRYKGRITHFWPSYLLEPQMTGVTLHELTNDVDGGDIIHQSAGPLVRGDGIHELACRVMKRFADEELPSALKMFVADELGPFKPQETNGKMWYSSEWRPEHLLPIYNYNDNNIVDLYLDGKITGSKPKLHRQF